MMKVRFSAPATEASNRLAITTPDGASMRIGSPLNVEGRRAAYARMRLQRVNRKNCSSRGDLVEEGEGIGSLAAAHHDRVAQAEAGRAEQFVEVRQQHVHPHALGRALRRRHGAELDLSEGGAQLRVVHLTSPGGGQLSTPSSLVRLTPEKVHRLRTGS